MCSTAMKSGHTKISAKSQLRALSRSTHVFRALPSHVGRFAITFLVLEFWLAYRFRMSHRVRERSIMCGASVEPRRRSGHMPNSRMSACACGPNKMPKIIKKSRGHRRFQLADSISARVAATVMRAMIQPYVVEMDGKSERQNPRDANKRETIQLVDSTRNRVAATVTRRLGR